MDTSDMSDLAAPLPVSSPMAPPSVAPPEQPRGGPGSVMVSEIDLSSPLNYGTPSSIGSSLRTPRSGVRGTPIRIRSDIQSEKRLRQVNVGGGASSSQGIPPTSDVPVPSSEALPPTSEAGSETGPNLVIWGTDVSVQVCKERFKKFIKLHKASAEEDEKVDGYDPNLPLYMQKLDEVRKVFGFVI